MLKIGMHHTQWHPGPLKKPGYEAVIIVPTHLPLWSYAHMSKVLFLQKQSMICSGPNWSALQHTAKAVPPQRKGFSSNVQVKNVQVKKNAYAG